MLSGTSLVGVSSSGDGMGDGGGGATATVTAALGGWSRDVGVLGVAGTGGGRFSSVGSEFESKPNRLLEKWKPFRLVEWSKSSSSWNEVKKLMLRLEIAGHREGQGGYCCFVPPGSVPLSLPEFVYSVLLGAGNVAIFTLSLHLPKAIRHPCSSGLKRVNSSWLFLPEHGSTGTNPWVFPET